jgi:hypothetical protein
MKFSRQQVLALSLLAFGFLALLSIPMRADFLLWLDGPASRSNSHDPKSPLYKPPITRSPTSGATFTISATPTISPSFTPSPTPSLTPLVYYDGEPAGASLAAGNRAVGNNQISGYSSATFAETGVGGAHGGAYFLSMSMAAVDNFIIEGPSNTSGASCDITAYNALSLWLRSPDACFPPMVVLHSPDGNLSAPVTFTAYTAAGAMLPNQWQQAVIPLAAFNGANINGGTYDLASSNHQIDAVALMAPVSSYVLDTNYGVDCFPADALASPTYWTYASVDMDDAVFVNTAPPAVRAYPAGFDPFVNGNGITAWDTPWQAWADTSSCMTPASAIIFPASDGNGGLLPPVDTPPALSGDTLVACYVGHVSGLLGAANGVAPCTASDLSLAYMIAGFQTDPTTGDTIPVNLASMLGFTPQGVSFYIAQGPNTSGVDVDFTLTKQAVQSTPDGPYADYFHRVTTSQLAGGNWVHVTVPFPASGVNGTDFINSFGQPSFAAANGDSVAWNTGDAIDIRIGPDPDSRGQAFDIYVDGITFY